MQNKIRAWSSLLLSSIFFTSVLMEYIPTPQDIIEFTFLANFGIGFLLLLTGIRLFWQKKAGNKNIYRRPVIMGNVDNIANGCYVKIYSSASHRYSVQWTGDIQSDFDALAQEI